MAFGQEVKDFLAAFTGMKKALGDPEDRALKRLRAQIYQLQLERIKRAMAGEQGGQRTAQSGDVEELMRRGRGAGESYRQQREQKPREEGAIPERPTGSPSMDWGRGGGSWDDTPLPQKSPWDNVPLPKPEGDEMAFGEGDYDSSYG